MEGFLGLIFIVLVIAFGIGMFSEFWYPVKHVHYCPKCGRKLKPNKDESDGNGRHYFFYVCPEHDFVRAVDCVTE